MILIAGILIYLLGLATGIVFGSIKEYDGTLSLVVDENGDKSYKLSIHDVDKIPKKEQLIISVETEIRESVK